MSQLQDGSYTAVVDSIEDGLATVFFEQDGEEIGDQVFNAEEIPADARHADAVLAVTISEGTITELTYRPEETTARQEQAQDRFDRLSKRPPDDDT